jgi:hypothetical protein
MELSRTFTTRSLLWGVVCGVILGIQARIAMRFVARESGLEGAFSLGGSLEVVTFGLGVGAALAWLFFIARHRVPLRSPWAGALYGLAIFLVFATAPPPAAQSALANTPDTPVATALLFTILFVGWGCILEFVYQRVARAR